MKDSKFNGGLLGLIGINILQSLLILITFGIGAPWAVCIKERWIAKHTIIDEKACADLLLQMGVSTPFFI